MVTPAPPKLKPASRRDVQRPKPMRTFTRIPQGPRMYRQPTKPVVQGGPGEPPIQFLDPSLHGSATEWIVYWALAKIFNNPKDPRVGPYIGGTPDWEYQKYAMGGRSRAGGAVIDFAVYTVPGGKPIGLRLATEFFHFFAGSAKIASDEIQKELLSRDFDIADIQDYEITGDPTGQAAIIKVKQALGLIASNPITLGVARRNRR
jgi:hypothetical protein